MELNFSSLFLFVEGLVSFFSPCVLPVIPLYLGYLGGSGGQEGEEGGRRPSLLLNALFFVLGISAAFFMLGGVFSLLGGLFSGQGRTISVLGGILILLMGLIYMDLLKAPFLQHERRLSVGFKTVNVLTAFLMGFAFSFSWTPCVGPTLASALIVSADSAASGGTVLTILLYILGFILPFLIIALFAQVLSKKLSALHRHLPLIRKIGGAVMVVMGILMATGLLGSINTAVAGDQPPVVQSDGADTQDTQGSEDGESDDGPMLAFDFTLVDQYGVSHTLSDYRGKKVFINFFATWCGPCLNEMPDLEALYQKYKDSDDVVVIAINAPGYGNEKDREGVIEFMAEKGYTFPILFDTSANVHSDYQVSGFPLSYTINTEGYFQYYASGQIELESMEKMLSLTE